MKEETKLNIYLIRHAEKDSEGRSISENGKKQALLLAKRLQKIKFKRIYSSDLTRCKDTTKIISKKIKAPIILDKNLREVEGKIKDYPEKHKKEINKIKKTWNKITKEKGNILIVGSGIINRILISLALKINSKNSRFTQIPTGLTHMRYINKNKTILDFVNDTSHLPTKLNKKQSY
tara:strand:- start:32 stop:562 length:531 start_codon:yes stop_codon:yes gene_type:complete